jgi:hypothetical protein
MDRHVTSMPPIARPRSAKEVAPTKRVCLNGIHVVGSDCFGLSAASVSMRLARSKKGKPRAAVGLILRTLNELGIFLDARNEPARKAKPSSSDVDLDALIAVARKPHS